VKKPQIKWTVPGVRDKFYFVLLGLLGPYTEEMGRKGLKPELSLKVIRIMREFGVSIAAGVGAGSPGMEWEWLTSTQAAVRLNPKTEKTMNWTDKLLDRRLVAIRAGFMSVDCASKLFDKNGILNTRGLLQSYKAGILSDDEVRLLMIERNSHLKTL